MNSNSAPPSGNRITLHNGNIGQIGSVGATIISASHLPNTTTLKTMTAGTVQSGAGGVHHQILQTQGAQPGQALIHHHPQPQQQQSQSVGASQTQTIFIKTNSHAVSLPAGLVSNASGIVTMTKSINQGNTQIMNSMIPSGVVVGMRPGNAQQQQQPKNVQGNQQLNRILINPHVVGPRQQAPAITNQTYLPPSAIILKADGAPMHILRVVGSSASGPTGTHNIGTNSTQIRLQNVPASSATTTTVLNNVIVNSVSAPNSTNQQAYNSQVQQQQQVPAINSNSNTNNGPAAATPTSTAPTSTTPAAAPQTPQANTKEKCRKFLANLIDLSTREPKPVERNVRNLIQELVNGNVEPEEFCNRLEKLLNASPQPCLIGFLRKSLPLLRQALLSKELSIDGIKAPPTQPIIVNTMPQLPKIQAHIRPLNQSQPANIGQTQVKIIGGQTIQRPIGHTTITKQPAGVRLPAPQNGPRLLNTQIRGSIPANIQLASVPQLHTNAPTMNIIRTPTASTLSRPGVQIKQISKAIPTTTNKITAGKVGQTHIKPITITSHPALSQPPSLAAISNTPQTPTLSSPMLSGLSSVPSSQGGVSLPVPSLPKVNLPPAALLARENNMNKLTEIKVEAPKIFGTIAPKLAGISRQNFSVGPKAAPKRKRDISDEKSNTAASSSASAAASASSFFQQNSVSSSVYGDDDINDVAAMGGVNLAEESQRILGSTDNIGTQIRSCKDEVLLNLASLQARIKAKTAELQIDEPSSQEFATLLAHACHEHLKNIIENIIVIAGHRTEAIKLDKDYEMTNDVRGQVKFLEELDKAEEKRREELEREVLLRAAKSRSRLEDPEQAKMKARAKEMQRAEMEEMRQREANLTALQAIGPRKKAKVEDSANGNSNSNSGATTSGLGTSSAPLRARIKRVNLRDLIFYMEGEREFCKSIILQKAYQK